MKQIIHIGDTPITLITKGLDTDLDIDKLSSIDYSNLYGEAVTVSSLLNKIGLAKAEAEAFFNRKKLELEIYESNLRKSFRVDADTNGGKFHFNDELIKLTEKSLDECVLIDSVYQLKKFELIDIKKDLDIVESWFWSISDKSKKLNNLLTPLTPEEFTDSLIEGSINTFIIKK